LAGGGAGLAPGLEVIPDAPAAPVGLGAGHGIPVDLGVGRRLLDPDAIPVGVELVGDDHRHGRQRALAHLGHRADHGHHAVTVHQRPLAPAPPRSMLSPWAGANPPGPCARAGTGSRNPTTSPAPTTRPLFSRSRRLSSVAIMHLA